MPVLLRQIRRKDFTNEAVALGLLTVLLLLGMLAMLPVTADLIRLWRDDPLRSFGAILPVLSIVLWVRVWRTMQWTHQGTWWGLLPVTLAIVIARTYGASLIAYRFNDIQVAPVQPGLLLFGFMSGVALLLGGRRLFWAVLFPLFLLLCANPVPHLFDRLDFPLQEVSANVARGFAHLLGVHPTGEQLQMMFAPRFGMVIVPGCNGVRGSVTMVYLALVLGYLKRYPWRRTALFMAAAMLLGYLLNFVRLCLLVVYYLVATRLPRLQPHGEMADYLIGALLFFAVTLLNGYFFLRPASASPAAPAQVPAPARLLWRDVFARWRWLCAACLFLLCAGAQVRPAAALLLSPPGYIAPEYALSCLPAQTGSWKRTSSWLEVYYDRPVWAWTEYQRADGVHVAMAMWLSPNRHFAIQSRMMNGSKPIVSGSFNAHTADGMPMELSSFTLNDDLVYGSPPTPTFFAETTCTPKLCSQQEFGFNRQGWLVGVTPAASGRRLPLLYRVQARPGTREDEATQQRAKDLIRELTAQLDLNPLVRKLGSR